MENKNKIEQARKLIDSFCERTGVTGNSGTTEERYLWTDALAVKTLMGLYKNIGDSRYLKEAENLIVLVHEHLGKHHPNDEREGWISGLIAEKGLLHPTVGGLRIGKKLPERKPDEPFDPQQEWERDGQYFHYNTKWIMSLIGAGNETENQQYTVYALELLLALGQFVYQKNGSHFMYWKMDTELSRPLVSSMGAHDPLEGLLCAQYLAEIFPEQQSELKPLIRKFSSICEESEWSTPDPLGVGSLLLNTLLSTKIAHQQQNLPGAVRPQKLFNDSLTGLENFVKQYSAGESANRRLAFRECGLSLGINAVQAKKDEVRDVIPQVDEITQYSSLAEELEDFWLEPGNHQSSTWKDHLNINAVSLAASIIAGKEASVFAG